MDWLKSIFIGRRTYVMAVVAGVLHYVCSLGIVTDPFLVDALTHMRDAAMLAIPVFMRMGIKAFIKN